MSGKAATGSTGSRGPSAPSGWGAGRFCDEGFDSGQETQCGVHPAGATDDKHRAGRAEGGRAAARFSLARNEAATVTGVLDLRPQQGSCMFEEFGLIAGDPISPPALLAHMGIGLVLSLVLQWHYCTFGSTLSNRRAFSNVFPFLVLTTVLIITVIKSSLALSLGLVGALSIVRFRTPIKEVEELAYIFLAIGMGLGLGAQQVAVTVLAAVVILGSMATIKRMQSGKDNKNLFLSINLNGVDDDPGDRMRQLAEAIASHANTTDLRRFDVTNGQLEATYFVDMCDPGSPMQLADRLSSDFPGVSITFVDQNRMPSV